MLNSECGIKWNSFIVELDGNSYVDLEIFELTPEDFVSFSETNFSEGSREGLIDALSNAKRAIDCQVDWILSYLGYDYKNFKDEKYSYLGEVILDFESELNIKINCSLKLRFIQALEIAPAFLVSKIRNIRNEMEHNYISPNEHEVREAIDIAKLFVNATQNIVLRKKFTNYLLYSVNPKKSDQSMKRSHEVSLPSINISFSFKDEGENVKYLVSYYPPSGEIYDVTLQPDCKEYVYLLKIGLTGKFNRLPAIFGSTVEQRFVNYEVIYS
ncbi:hypothetical protein JCM9140_3624 [Halalkalibacter wakoensis JCM 9140]|uniref:DUF4145 domain-containing protein n=1 Tax=Halalkalibacter wakoensis JCM 9140 TaxID=1236970 RepID=W4Q5Y9_9BACI|nr:hypothetical protein [Halalkalibacter wakoensis]GAE27476.1 hypothetical protein JCM9140_3624 [Halalkalibacter wakoensis JCM 9140]